MSRRKAREVALQTLFQLDYNETQSTMALEAVYEEHNELNSKTKEYAEQLVAGTQQYLKEIDAILEQTSSEWKVDRMMGVDRNIARMAVFEMKFSAEEIPPNVVINEAVELAKLFGTAESGRFLNGILGSLARPKV